MPSTMRWPRSARRTCRCRRRRRRYGGRWGRRAAGNMGAVLDAAAEGFAAHPLPHSSGTGDDTRRAPFFVRLAPLLTLNQHAAPTVRRRIPDGAEYQPARHRMMRALANYEGRFERKPEGVGKPVSSYWKLAPSLPLRLRAHRRPTRWGAP